jgi:hypothetical protein
MKKSITLVACLLVSVAKTLPSHADDIAPDRSVIYKTDDDGEKLNISSVPNAMNLFLAGIRN